MSNGRSIRRQISGKSGRSPRKSQRRQAKVRRAHEKFQASQQESLDSMKGTMDSPQYQKAVRMLTERALGNVGGALTEQDVQEVAQELGGDVEAAREAHRETLAEYPDEPESHGD